MPQSNRDVASFDLVADLNSYYHNSVLGIVDKKSGDVVPVQVREVCWGHDDAGERFARATIRSISKDGQEWTSGRYVPFDDLILTLPYMSMVESDGHWFHLCRTPARRMRKGFHQETVTMIGLEDGHRNPIHEVTHPHIVKQAWAGNADRISANVVVWGQGIYYTTEKVATINDEGGVILVPHKEKLGEFVCKLLASNWESVISKHSVRTLPSSVPVPLA